MSQEPENQKDMEELSRAIVEALLGSNDVKRSLEKLNKIGAEAHKNFMVFVLKIDSLAKQKEKEKGRESLELKAKPVRKTRKSTRQNEIIDGKIISKSEKKFMDYLSKNFDQNAWLKWLKLTLD